MTARIVLRMSVVVFLLYNAVTQKCPASGRFESSIIGWMLRGHVYDTLVAELPFTCVFKCREDNRCQSFNWVISLLTCEFNNRTKEARPEVFIPNSERSYYPRDLKRGEPAYHEEGDLPIIAYHQKSNSLSLSLNNTFPLKVVVRSSLSINSWCLVMDHVLNSHHQDVL